MASRGPFSKTWDELDFTDNFMFCKILQNDKDLCRRMLEILLGIEIDRVKVLESEKTIDLFYDSRSVRLDVYAKNSKQAFDLEMQTCNYDNLLLRARYYQGAMDQEEMERSDDFSKLKDSYVIFLCKDDPIGLGGYVYTKESFFKEYPTEIYNDKTHIVFYNSRAFNKVEDKELRNVLEFIYNANSNSEFTDELVKSVDDAKVRPEWRKEYMKFSEVLKNNSLKIAKNMLEDGVPIEKIIQYTNLKKEDIEALSKKIDTDTDDKKDD